MKKLLSILASGIILCSAIAPFSASAAVYSNDGTKFNYCGMGSYGLDAPASKVSGYSAKKITTRYIYSGSERQGSYECWYNRQLAVYNKARIKVYGIMTGVYYDGTVNCWGGWVAETATKRASSNTTLGLTSSWIYDDNSTTTWCAYSYFN